MVRTLLELIAACSFLDVVLPGRRVHRRGFTSVVDTWACTHLLPSGGLIVAAFVEHAVAGFLAPIVPVLMCILRLTILPIFCLTWLVAPYLPAVGGALLPGVQV